MELRSTRVYSLVIFMYIIGSQPCSVKSTPCMDLICPEVHVETCSNPCHMTTQAYSVPRCSCGGCNCGGGSCSCGGGSCSCGPPPCQYPYPYPYPPPAAPSYCVQSVVVGGKPESTEDKKNSSSPQTGSPQTGKSQPKPRTGGPRIGASDPSLGGLDPGIFGGGGNAGGGAGGGLGGGGFGGGAIDPLNARFGAGGGGYLDPVSAFTGGGGGGRLAGIFDPAEIAARTASSIAQALDPSRNKGSSDTDKYEKYIERLLDVMKEKMDPDTVEPSPMMVMSEPRVRVKKIRRRKQRKYMLESCEEPDPVVVVEEEEEPALVLAQPCFRPNCCCRHRVRCC